MNIKIGTEVDHVTCDSDTAFKVKKSTCCWCLKLPTYRNRCHLANKYEDIVNLQGAEAYFVATRTACFLLMCYSNFVPSLWDIWLGT